MFVVFEGIDGSGKTTVSNQVAERLRAARLNVKHLRADGRFVSAVSEAIRELGRDARHVELVPQAEFLLYVARDVQLIEEALRPALASHDVVIADRFLYTAEILGQNGRHLPEEFTAPILRAAAFGLEPDLVVLMDVDPVLARARRKAHKLSVSDKRPPSRKGLSGVGLQHRLRKGYLELAAKQPKRWVVLENEDSLEATVSRVANLIMAAHAEGAPRAVENFRAADALRERPALPPIRSTEGALSAFLGWVDRRMQHEPRVAAYVLGGLFGPGIDARRRALKESVPDAVLAALSGLTDDVSFELRNELRESHPRQVVRTLSGIPSSDPRAARLRTALEPIVPEHVVESFSRLDDEAAWSLRERLFDAHADIVVATLSRLDTERAWALREKWLARRGAQLEDDYETARVALKSVTGLSGERAWELRIKARRAAPVATLASIGQLTDALSWRMREEFLHRAPKVVMGSLKGLNAPAAWEMRRTVIADCKEALDSMQGLNDPEAWELREAELDRWPSTVVKTLGVLADAARGMALIERQLAAHPANISLLKHASAVALGVHRVEVFED